jgi:hypothetical protein
MEKDERLNKAKELYVGGDVSDSMVDLYIYSEDIDIPALSKLLECEPTHAQRKGEVIKKRAPASIGFWCLKSPDNLLLPEKISYLIEKTTCNHAIWDQLNCTHKLELRCAVFLHSWTEGFEVPADITAEIGNRHWKFGMSMYSAEGNEIIEAFLKGNNEPKF